MKKEMLKKGLCISVTAIYVINSAVQAVPIEFNGRSSQNCLRELSTGLDGQTPVALREDLAATGEAFPVKLVAEKRRGIDLSRQPGDEKVLATAKLSVWSSGARVEELSPSSGSALGDDASAAAAVYAKGINWFIEHNKANEGIFDLRLKYATDKRYLPFQIVKDNDRLVDCVPVSRDIANPELGIRIDSDLVTQFGITLKKGVGGDELQCENPTILKGAIILSAMSFLHEICHIAQLKGLKEREAINAAADLFLTLSEEDKNALIEILRTEKIDSGNIFNIFLRSITDAELAEEVEGIDIREYCHTPSWPLNQRAHKLDEKAGKRSSDEDKELEDIEATLRWRDKQISWLMLLERIDLPFDYETVAEIMKEGYRKQKAGEPFNVDDWQAELHEVVTKSFNPEIEDRNILAIAKWANQNGIRLVSGRLGRAFENQARMVSNAKYVVVTSAMRNTASRLYDSVKDIEELRIPAQKLVLLLAQKTKPSYAQFDVAIRAFGEAAIDYQAEETKRLQNEKVAYRRRIIWSRKGAKKKYDEQIEIIRRQTKKVLEDLDNLRYLLSTAQKQDAAFVFLIQRLTPTGIHKMAKAATFRDVDPGKEEDIRDLLRTGGHLAYCTSGQGKEFNVLQFMDDIIEAIPMLVKERIIRIQRPDGTYFDVTQAEVDQKGMEVFFRNVFAPNFLKNIQHAMDTQHIELAREILYKIPLYRGFIELNKDLSFPQLMEAISTDCWTEFPEHVVNIAAMIDQSYWNLIDEISAYRNKTGSDRITAVREVILGKNRNTTEANLINTLFDLRHHEEIGTKIGLVTEKTKEKRFTQGLEKRAKRIAPYWDWKARRIPTLHDLTTQAPGLTEAYIQTWAEEEMALINILADNPDVAEEVAVRRGEYAEKIIACTEEVLREYGMEAVVEDVWHKFDCPNRETALFNMLTIFPFIANEVAKLIVLTEHEDKVESYINKHSEDADFVNEAIEGVVALNGLTLQSEISRYQEDAGCDYGEAGLAVIMQDEGYRKDYENQKLFCARRRVIDVIDKEQPQAKIKDKVKNFVRDHTALSMSTARKEAVARHGLQRLILNPKYHYSAEGVKKMYNLLYTPSRVNIGDRELESVQVWSQAVGAKDAEAARAGYDFYRLINSSPVVYASTKIAEALKVMENGAMMSQLAFANSFAMFLNSLGVGDAQRLIDEMMSRGDRMIPMPGEGYGGYCVPKDGLFSAFLVALTQEHKLADMGVDSRFHKVVIELAKEALMERPKFETEFEWEMWAAEHILNSDKLPEKVREIFKDYVDVAQKEDTGEPILVFNITNLAKIISSVGRPSPEIATGEEILWNVLAEWGLDANIIQAERINRMMPFVKAWMILRHHPKKVNLTAEYKNIADSDGNVGDVRFSTGIRIFEILTGVCDHLIRQFDEEGQNIARLLRFGFNPESPDGDIKRAAEWFMEKFHIVKDDKTAIERLKRLMPYYEPPEDIILTASSGMTIGDIMNYTSDRQVSTDDIATIVQQAIQELGLSDKQIAAASDVHGADITKWPILKENAETGAMLDRSIGVKGLDGQTYRYPLRSAIHYLALKQRTIARDYESGLQGCDAVNLGVVSGSLEKIAKNPPKLLALMLNEQPDAEPKIFDGSPGKARDVSRAFMDPDVKLFFATCENMDKNGVYEAIGWGKDDIERLRQDMHRHRTRALALLEALEFTAISIDDFHRAEAAKNAQRALEMFEHEINLNNEAIHALEDEEMFRRWKKWQPRDKWISLAHSNLAAGMPLTDFDFGTWLAMGGMYVLAGKSREEINKVRDMIERAVSIAIATEEGLTRKTDERIATAISTTDIIKKHKRGPHGFLPEESEECIASLLMPEYQPEAEEFREEKLVEISSKAIEASATQARERRRALEKRAAVARAQRVSITAYKDTLEAIEKKEKSADIGNFIKISKQHLGFILGYVKAIVEDRDSPTERLDELNSSYGVLSAWVNKTLELLINELAGSYAPEDPRKDKQLQEQLKRDLRDLFGINGFNVEAIKKFFGGYESDGDLAILAQAARSSRLGAVTDAIELLYSLYAITQTIEYLQVRKEDIDQRMLWDSLTVFFAETINDHFYEYTPWAYLRGTGYKDVTKRDLYKLASEHHRWLYEYLRLIMINLSEISETLRWEGQNLLLGNHSRYLAADAIGADYERTVPGVNINPGEGFWRAYGQLREITFIMNDGLAAMELLKQNPDLKAKGFEENYRYPLPVVFDDFDPALIDADNRVNMALLFPVGRTHISKLLRAGASCNLKRIEQGKKGLNAIITRLAPIKEIKGKKVVVLRNGHFYMNKDEFENALRICKGYSKRAAEKAIEDLEKQGSMIDGKIRVAAIFSRPIIATSVVPFHHLPTFDEGDLEDAGIPATCQSLYTEAVTYNKSLYGEMLGGTGVNLPKEMQWLAKWTEEGKDEEAISNALKDFVRELTEAGEEPLIIVKGAAESGARNMKTFLLKDQRGKGLEEALDEAARFILMVSRTPQDVVIQRAIRTDPQYWGTEDLMSEFVDRRLIERSSPVIRGKYPRTPYYCSFRVVPSSSGPDTPYDMTNHIVVMNTQIATNVGRGGSLEPLLDEWIQENHRAAIRNILEEASSEVMKAIHDFASQYKKRFEKEHRRDVGKDALGNSYAWMPFALVDFLVEPVFEREGKIVDVRPRYDGEGERIGSDIILEDKKGNKFTGKIKDWRTYLVEPNTGIGQIDRRTLRMEELEIRKAARERKPVDWNAIEKDDYTVLNNWADTGERYGQKLFGKRFFKPSPQLDLDKAPVRIGLSDYLAAAKGLVSEEDSMQIAVSVARKALRLKDKDKFDEVALSVLLKYYIVGELKPKYNVDDIRRKFLQEGLSWDGYEDFMDDITSAITDTRSILTDLAPLCKNVISVTEDELDRMLTNISYMSEIKELVRAHFITEWLGQEVEVLPEPINPHKLMSFMSEMTYVLGHISRDNPAAPNETYALMIDTYVAHMHLGMQIGIVGVDANDLIHNNSAATKVLALLFLPDQGQKRLIKAHVDGGLPLDAIWRDETCPGIPTPLVQVNPTNVSRRADDKAETLKLLAEENVAVPPWLFIGKGTVAETIIDRAKEFLGESPVVTNVFVSPNTGTQAIGTRCFRYTGNEQNRDAVLKEIADYITTGPFSSEGVIIRKDVEAAEYYSEEDKLTYALDLRYNVAYRGKEEYSVISGYAVVAQDPNDPVVSVSKNGRIIKLRDAHEHLKFFDSRHMWFELGEPKVRFSLKNPGDLFRIIDERICNALAALNKGFPENEKLLLAGVDVKLHIGILANDTIIITPVVLEINPKPAGLSHSYGVLTEVPSVNPYLWGYLQERIAAQMAETRSPSSAADASNIAPSEPQASPARELSHDRRVKQAILTDA